MDKFLKRKTDQKSEDFDDKDKREKRKNSACRPMIHTFQSIFYYGFIAVGTNADRPLCVMCVQTLSNHDSRFSETREIKAPFNDNACRCCRKAIGISRATKGAVGYLKA